MIAASHHMHSLAEGWHSFAEGLYSLGWGRYSPGGALLDVHYHVCMSQARGEQIQ